MRRVYDGLVYDTDKAEEICYWSNSYPVNDFNHCQETLYRTPNGRWFIHGEGGPMTKYAEPVGGDAKGAGQEIIPLPEEKVVEWLEDNNMIKELETHFPDHLKEA